MTVAQAGPANGEGLRLAISVAELRARAMMEPYPAWVVAPFLPDIGVAILAGPPKSGKTWVALGMLTAAAAGKAFADCFPTRVTRSLILEAEGTGRDLSRRLDAVARGLGLPDAGVLQEVVVSPPDLTRQNGFHLDDNWARVLGEFCGANAVRAVAIDSVRRLSNLEENDAAQVAALVQPLSDLARNLRMLIVLLHHTRKPAGRGGPINAFDVRGSGDWFAAADSVLMVTRDDTLATITAIHREHEEQSFRLRMAFSAIPALPGFIPVNLAGVPPAGAGPTYCPAPPPWSVRFTLDRETTAAQATTTRSAAQDAAIRAVLSAPGSVNLTVKEARRRVRAAGVKAGNGVIDTVFREVRQEVSNPGPVQ